MIEEKKYMGIPRAIWIQLLLLGIGYMFYSSLRISFGVGLKAMSKEIALTLVQMGTLGTIFTLGQGLIDLPAGYLADKLGRKKLLLIGMIGIGVTTMAVTTADNFFVAAVWRFLFGATEGCWNVVMYSVAGSIFPASRATLNGLMMSFYSIGGAVGPAYYSWALEDHTWKYGLMTMGAATLAYGLFLIWGLKAKYTDRARDVKSVNVVQACRAVGGTRGVWVGISLALLTIFSYWGFGSMGPYLFVTYKGFTQAMVGNFFAVTYGIGGLSAVLMGYFSDKFGRKPVILTLSVLNAICFYLIIHVIPTSNMAMMYLVGGILGIGLHAGSVLGYCVAQDSVPLHQVGLAQGLAGSVAYGSTFISGPAVGYLTKLSGYLTALDVVCIGSAVMMVIISVLMRESHRKIVEEN